MYCMYTKVIHTLHVGIQYKWHIITIYTCTVTVVGVNAEPTILLPMSAEMILAQHANVNVIQLNHIIQIPPLS